MRADAESPRPVAAPPSAGDLLALDRQATGAFFRGDAAFFENLLSDRFVMLGPDGSRLGKDASTAMIAGVRCDVKEGWTLDEPRLTHLDADTAVLTYRGTFDGTCTVGGRSAGSPSPVRGATVWVRSGDEWQAAFHGENPILDPRAAATPSSAATTAGDSEASGERAASEATAPAADADTQAMIAAETAVWDAWKDRDRERLEALTASELAFVDIFGNVTHGKAETLAFWTGNSCDVKSSRVAGGTATLLSPTVGILTFQGILEGTCGGQKFPLIHGTSVYTKAGDLWKLAFTLNHLVN